MNETDVREEVVRPFLNSLGYRHGTEANIRTEQYLRYARAFLGRKNEDKDPVLTGRADYICEVIGFGRWIVEVKSPKEDLSQDEVEQAHTYAAHPDVGAQHFLLTNGRTFRLYQTSRLEQPLMEWAYDEIDQIILKLSNIIGPDSIKRRAKLFAIDPGKPLGKGLASRVKIVGGHVLYENHESSHPLLDGESINGMQLPVIGGSVQRTADGRLRGFVQMAQSVPLVSGLNELLGRSDDYEFFAPDEYVSTNREAPNIFQNLERGQTKPGAMINLPGFGKLPVPFRLAFTSRTEAIGFVEDTIFRGTMQLTYDLTVLEMQPMARRMLEMQKGRIPDAGTMTGAGRFEVILAEDI